jgi:hypothetical protein
MGDTRREHRSLVEILNRRDGFGDFSEDRIRTLGMTYKGI